MPDNLSAETYMRTIRDDYQLHHYPTPYVRKARKVSRDLDAASGVLLAIFGGALVWAVIGVVVWVI